MSMTAATSNSYDDVPYVSHAQMQSHPDRLAVVATLLGLKPAPVERCRVLELGCASGGNLLPMAQALPESTFVGIELSARQAAEGQKIIAALPLPNVEIKQMSILDVGPDLGKFNYILCHGVYSWVPPDVQDKMLRICVDNLAAGGIAYVSYNVLPGWHMRGMLRDMMLYHANRFQVPQARIEHARQLLGFLARSVPQDNAPYSLLLRNGVEMLNQAEDAYLYHEYLEENNDPIYFHQFVERAEAHGLRYLGEADVSDMLPRNFSPEVQQVLQRISSSSTQIEQFMDFLRNRTFRQTLLVPRNVQPSHALLPERLSTFHIASSARPESANPDIQSPAPESFRGLNDAILGVQRPLIKAAMLVLYDAFPGSLPFNELCTRARERVGSPWLNDPAAVAADANQLATDLLTLYTNPVYRVFVELRTRRLPVAVRPGERPRATPLARWQATAANHVANLCHQEVLLGELERQLLRQLDGTRNFDALIDTLEGLASRGELVIQQKEKTITDPTTIRELLRKDSEIALRGLARSSLLFE
jgi:methyltransferase-like protein/SAM-dependent methyltransferase